MNVASAVRLSILFVVVALFALLMPPGCSGSSRSTRQTETPARSPAALEIAMELPMPALVVFDPSGPGDLDSLLRRTYMKKYILDPTQNPGLSSDASARLLATLRTAIPGCVSAFAVEAASRRDVEAAHREAQRRVLADAPSGWLLVYGKLRGQTSGSAGMLFRDSNLGWPHPGFTPIGALVHDWDELRGLLGGAASPAPDRVMILHGPSEFAGSYVVTGFEESEVPEWARPLLQTAGKTQGQETAEALQKVPCLVVVTYDARNRAGSGTSNSGIRLAVWEDGTVLRAVDPLHPDKDGRMCVGRLTSEQAAAAWAALGQSGFFSEQDTILVTPDSQHERVSVTLRNVTRTHALDTYHQSQTAWWPRVEAALEQFRPDDTRPVAEDAKDGAFRGFIVAEWWRTPWVR